MRLSTRDNRCWGVFTPEMTEAVRPFVLGQHVWDLGAGHLGHAERLLDLGASRVTVVDKKNLPSSVDPRIEVRGNCLFSDLVPGPMDVIWWSWPINHYCEGLDALLDQAEIVIYLGCNVNGTACGDILHFDRLIRSRRRIEAHVPHPRNSLIIYGAPYQRQVPLLPEEIALSRPDVMSWWDDVHSEWIGSGGLL